MIPVHRVLCALLIVSAKELCHRLLSAEDREHLSTYGAKLGTLHDFVMSTASGADSGLFIHGKPGTGKTHAVTSILRQKKSDWVLCNTEVTARGLFDTLRANHRSVFVFDDVHSSLVKPQTLQVSLAAFNGKLDESRPVVYTTGKNGREEIQFRGGAIVITNRRVRENDPVAKALISRLHPLHFDPTDAELLAMTRVRCLKGKDGLSARECFKVLDFVGKSGKRFDLRSLERALSLYKFCRDTRTCNSWETLVLSSMDEHVDDLPVVTFSREETKDRESLIAADLLERFPHRKQRNEREQEWSRITGKSSDSLFRRLRELKAKKRAA